jgi:hypothetical protein
MPPDLTPALYTSCERDGAIAEIAFHWKASFAETCKN